MSVSHTGHMQGGDGGDPITASNSGEVLHQDHLRESLTSPTVYDQGNRAHQRRQQAKEVNVGNTMDIDLHLLPQRWLANHLVECYMSLCHPQYPFLHAATFHRDYENLWTSSSPPHPHFSGTANAVFALGCHFSPGMYTRVADLFFQRAKNLIFSEPEPSGDDQSVTNILQALALLAMYPQGPQAQEEVWDIVGMMIRLLPRLKLTPAAAHSYEEKLGHEMSIRLWWACFVLDAVYSSYFGREPRLPHAGTEIRFPLPLDDESCQTDVAFASGSSLPPPSIFFFTETIRLCGLMQEIAMSYTAMMSAAQTLEIDQKILDWYSSIPFMHSIKITELPHGRVWRQCEVLTSRFLHLRIFLLTRHLKTNYPLATTITAFSSVKEVADLAIQPMLEEACVKAAVELIKHLDRFYSAADGPHSAWWYDLKKIMSSSRALLLYLDKMAESPGPLTIASVTPGETEQEALGVAVKLLRQIEDSGKSQATDVRRRLEREIHAVQEKLRKFQFSEPVAVQQGEITDLAVYNGLPDFNLPEDIAEQEFFAWEAFDSSGETMDPIWLDLLH